MADLKKKETKRPQAAKPKAVTLAEMPSLARAVERFIRGNTLCEASFPINAALEEMGQYSDLMSVFTAALQHQLFGVDAALRWLLFLSLAPDHAVSEGDVAFAQPLPITEALDLISTVYDVGVQNVVWENFEEDEDEGEDETEDEDAEEEDVDGAEGGEGDGEEPK